jgi:hypothetical protein
VARGLGVGSPLTGVTRSPPTGRAAYTLAVALESRGFLFAALVARRPAWAWLTISARNYAAMAASAVYGRAAR